jgi:hypothetical protein
MKRKNTFVNIYLDIAAYLASGTWLLGFAWLNCHLDTPMIAQPNLPIVIANEHSE